MYRHPIKPGRIRSVTFFLLGMLLPRFAHAQDNRHFSMSALVGYSAYVESSNARSAISGGARTELVFGRLVFGGIGEEDGRGIGIGPHLELVAGPGGLVVGAGATNAWYLGKLRLAPSIGIHERGGRNLGASLGFFLGVNARPPFLTERTDDAPLGIRFDYRKDFAQNNPWSMSVSLQGDLRPVFLFPMMLLAIKGRYRGS
jgi:hypothetical protein